MKNAFDAVKVMGSFARDEDGANVVEYALLIALASIVLAIALATVANGGMRDAFSDLVARVKTCFSAGATTC